MTSGSTRFATLALGLFGLHFCAGVVQESIFHIPGFHFVGTLAFFQSFFQLAVAALGYSVKVSKSAPYVTFALPERKCPLRYYILVGVMLFSTSYLTHYSNKNLGYALTVLFKSAKPLVTLAVAVFFGKPWNFVEVGGITILLSGVASFSLMSAKSSSSSTFSTLGLAAVSIAVVIDALMVVVQERFILRRTPLETRGTKDELMFYQMGFACLFAMPAAASDGFSEALSFALTTPSFVGRVAIHAVLNVVAVGILFSIVKEFSAVHATIVTTVRKTATVVMSYVLFPKKDSLTALHFAALSLIVVGFMVQENAREISNRLRILTGSSRSSGSL